MFLLRWVTLMMWALAILLPELRSAPPVGPALPGRFLKSIPEPLGPSSRRGPLVLSEVMYHPADRLDGRNSQFIEVFNSQVFFEDLSGWSLRGDINFTFPSNTFLGARSFIVVAANLDDFRAAYPVVSGPVLGPFDGGASLPTRSGSIRLQNRLGAVSFELKYREDARWPVAANGAGHSLVLARPSYGERDPFAWGPSERPGGSPGSLEPDRTQGPLDSMVINELLAHAESPPSDYVELYNYSDNPVDLSGCILTDDPATNRFVVPAGTEVAPRSWQVFSQSKLGFGLDAAGERLFLFAPDRKYVLDAVQYEAQGNGVAWGRYPDGAAQFSRQQHPTPGEPNSAPLISPVVLNELMYHPPSELPDDQYLELHNSSDTALNLSGWRLEGGVSFTFPGETGIAAHDFLVVAKNTTRLATNYPGLTAARLVGEFSGSLSGQGERLMLTQPDFVTQTNRSGKVSTKILHVIVDEVTYGTGGRWGKWADGGGSSLERRDPLADGRSAANWADSDETQKSPWITVEATGPTDLGNTGADAFQILTEGPGECLIDDLEVMVAGGTNRVINHHFKTSITNWTFQGNHAGSSWEPIEGASAPGSLHLRATGAGTTGPNRAFTKIASIPASTTANTTLRARVRWLKGTPNLLLRLKGNYLEAPGNILATATLGSPGAPNTAYQTQSAPIISEVSHYPVLPRANEVVRISARIQDRAGLGVVTLWYHPDSTTNYNSVLLTNAGAGWFSAELPALTGFQQFFIVATNALGARASFPDDAPHRECNLRYSEGSVSGALGQYHLWVSKTNVTRWTRRAKLANDLIDTTFVYGSDRVIYNAGSQYSGSPFHAPSYDSPTGANCDYVLVAPPDDRFLGEEELNLLQPGNGGGDGTGQAEQHAYWIADQLGLPHCHRRHILLWFNGIKRGVVYEDAQQPNSDFIKQWFPDDAGGELHKIQLWFEFEADGSTFTQIGADLGNYLSRGKKKLARYRWTWPLRGFGNYPNNYTNIFNLVDAVNVREIGDRYVHALEQATDVGEWFHTHVTEHLVGNNDSYSYGGGQNMYAYLPQHGPWQLLIWDIDFAFSAGGPTEDMVMIGGTTVGPVNTNPTFSRKYYQAMLEAVNGPLMTNRYQPILDSRFAGLRSHGASGVASPSGIKSYLKIRRDSLIRQLTNGSPALSLSAALTNGVTRSANLVTLTGTAPLNARVLTLNGEPITVTWTTRTAWTAKIPFPTGSNTWLLSGLDGVGLPITNPPVPVVVVVTGVTESPVGRIVFTEILPTPRWPGGATWIELQNLSTTTAFDLSGWRIEGIHYTLPAGTFLAPNERLVIPSDRFVFNQTYGSQLRVAGEFSGQLDPFGETLKLVQPGVIVGQDVLIDEVRYSTLAPWPTPEPGYSLQLIDSTQDARRAANWLTANQNGGAPDLGPSATPGLANTGAHPLPPLAPLALNELMVDNTETLRDNMGRFRPWVELYNDSDHDQLLTQCFLSPTTANLAAWSFPGEAVVPAYGFLIVWLDGDTAASTAAAPHTDFIVGRSGFLVLSQQVENRIGTLDSIQFLSPGPDRSFGDFPDGDLLRRHSFSTATPSATNTLRAPDNSVFINEWLADNRTTLADPADGKFEDWFELYNAGARPINLAGYYLGNSPTNGATFQIPPSYVLAAGGHLLVWADREPEQNVPQRGDLHTNFKLSKNAGTITLANPDGILLDAVSFGIQLPDISQGREPDGGNHIGILNPPTPRLANPPAPPRFTSGILVEDQLALGFVGLPSQKYRIESRISLAFDGGPWEALSTSVTDAQGHGSYSAIRSPNSVIAFFRLVLVP